MRRPTHVAAMMMGGDDEATAEDDADAVVPRRPSPFVDIEVEIQLPAKGHAMAEGVPFMEDGYDVVNVDMAELQKELSQPHGVLRMRLKEALQNHIMHQAIKPVAGPPKRREYSDPDPPKPLTKERALGLRESSAMPVDTGGAYMMKGPTPAEAPFFGGHKYNFTGTVEVTCKGVPLPASYQPYRDEHEQPHGREPPDANAPAGARRPPHGGRQFHCVRPRAV